MTGWEGQLAPASDQSRWESAGATFPSGIANVVVSDGYHVVRTDKKGKYELDIHAEAVAVFVSTPSGYAFTNQKGISRHYHLLKDINPKNLSISAWFLWE